jgi:predicted SnoaL-like aldol condensation-catalyzing enzyme
VNRRDLLAVAALATMPAVTSAVAQEAATPHALATRFAATLSAHDMAGFANLFGETYVNHQTSASSPPPPAGLSAKAGSVGFFAARLAGMPDLHVDIETIVADGDKVAASFVYTGTHGGTYFGVAPTGRTLRFTSCDIFRVADGRFVEHWGMGDAAGIMVQLKA